MVKEIQLQSGMVALVDDEDYEKVNAYVWWVSNSNGKLSILTNIDGKIINLRRFISNVNDENIRILHKNKNIFDCRRKNLIKGNKFLVSIAKKGDRVSTSKYKGVHWKKSRNKWVAQIDSIHIGCFIDEDEAALAYNKAALERYGRDAYLNVIGENNNCVQVKKDWPHQRRRG